MNYFERACFLKDINHELFSEKWSPLDRCMPGRAPPLEQSPYKIPDYLKSYQEPHEAFQAYGNLRAMKAKRALEA